MITDEHHGAGAKAAGQGGRDWASAWDSASDLLWNLQWITFSLCVSVSAFTEWQKVDLQSPLRNNNDEQVLYTSWVELLLASIPYFLVQ